MNIFRVLKRAPQLKDYVAIDKAEGFADFQGLLKGEERLFQGTKHSRLEEILKSQYHALERKKKVLVETERACLAERSCSGHVFDFLFDGAYLAGMSREDVVRKYSVLFDRVVQGSLSRLGKLEGLLEEPPESLASWRAKVSEQESVLVAIDEHLQVYREQLVSELKKDISLYGARRFASGIFGFSKRWGKKGAKAALLASLPFTLTYLGARAYREALPEPEQGQLAILISEPNKWYERVGEVFVDVYVMRVEFAVGQQASYVMLPAHKGDLVDMVRDEQVSKVVVMGHGSWSSWQASDGSMSEEDLRALTQDISCRKELFLRHTCGFEQPQTMVQYQLDSETASELVQRSLAHQMLPVVGFEEEAQDDVSCEISFYPISGLHMGLERYELGEQDTDLRDIKEEFERRILDDGLYERRLVTPEMRQFGACVVQDPAQVHGWTGLVSPYDFLSEPVPSGTRPVAERHPSLKPLLRYIMDLGEK